MRVLLTLLALALLLAVPWITQAIGQPALLALATRIAIYSIAVASLNFILGYGGLVSFGHAAFFGVGGYVVGILFAHHTWGTPVMGLFPGTNLLIVTVPVAVLVSGILAAAVGALSLRTGGVQFIMITLAFAQMIFFFFISLQAYGGEDGIIIRRPNEFFGLNLRDRMTMYYVALGFATGFFWLLWRVIHSSFGAVIRGIRQNERRMAALGFATYRYKLFAFVLSGMGSGLAGALMANYLRFASPDMLAWQKSGEFIIMVVLGGMGSFVGPILGTAVFLTAENYLAAWSEHWKLGLGLVLLVVVLGTRGGIMAALGHGARVARLLVRGQPGPGGRE